MTARARLTAALEATRDWHSALPSASAFCPWPDDLQWADYPATPGPATPLILAHPGETSAAAEPLLRALQAVTHDVEWRHAYTEAEVGRHFLDNFGWFELAGPTGHFTTRQTRITVAYWGAGLDYPRHQHTPEELYTIVSGEAQFMADGEADRTLRAGDTRFHAANQPHAMITHASPIFTLVFWRGEGLADPPRMTT